MTNGSTAHGAGRQMPKTTAVDVEATIAILQAEVNAQRRMIEQTQERFGLWPKKLVADTAYGSASMLNIRRGISRIIPPRFVF